MEWSSGGGRWSGPAVDGPAVGGPAMDGPVMEAPTLQGWDTRAPTELLWKAQMKSWPGGSPHC